MKILIADDDALSLTVHHRMLQSLGHEVVKTGNGQQAWEFYQAEPFEVVISDWMMPGLDGLQLCRAIRADARRATYPYVILLTARSLPQERVAGYESGADDFLAKPLDRGELMARLGVAARIIGMQEELKRRALQLEAAHVELKAQCVRLAEIATSDGLTGLKNRAYFSESLESAFSFAVRQSFPLSVVMVDVDHFKAYNDNHGHPAGDFALSEIARMLRDNVRDHDLVARYGGEEFIILLPATDAASARLFCERLRGRIAARAWPLRPITASFGIATNSSRVLEASNLIDEADRALYASKRLGRNRVSHFEDSLEPVH